MQVKVLADLDEPASEPRSEGGGYPFELSRVDGKRSWRLSAGSAEERAPRRAEYVFLDSTSGLSSTAFDRIRPHSYPSCSRGALNPLHNTVFPP